MQGKFTISFHESFSLSRISISQIIENAKKIGKLDRKHLINTALGKNYQKAMPRYAVRTGLLDTSDRLTSFGVFAVQHDPALEKPITQWMMHYHLAAPHGSTAFWHYLVRKRFLPGETFTANELFTDLVGFTEENTGKIPAERSLRSTVTIFTGTYLKTDGLGRLGLLDEAGDGYRIPPVGDPPLWTLGYALADYWSAYYPGRLTINLDDLTRGDFAAIFLLGEDRLTKLLLQLKQEGVLDLYRVSQPYQVVLLQPSPEYALQKMYEI